MASWLSFTCTDKNISVYYTTETTGPDSKFFEHREIQYLSNFHCLSSSQTETSLFRCMKQFQSKTEQQVAHSHKPHFQFSYSFVFHFHCKAAMLPNTIPLEQTGLPAERLHFGIISLPAQPH